MKRAGVDVLLGVDSEPACRFPYTANSKSFFLNMAVQDLQPRVMFENPEVFPKRSLSLLAGCAPCQPFSRLQSRDSETDDRWMLLQHFGRLVIQIRPILVAMENVPDLRMHRVFGDFLALLKDAGYHACSSVVDCSDYGLPQDRKRLVLLASRFGMPEILLPAPFARKVTVRDAIGHLPCIQAGEAGSAMALHRSQKLSAANMQRMKASKPGGTWRDWPRCLLDPCHARASGRTFPDVYGRMEWDKPSPTITTQFFGYGNGRFGHPDQDRAISLLEGAILQGFPEDYQFVIPGTKPCFRAVGRMIGNAVPPLLGELIGRSLIEHALKHA